MNTTDIQEIIDGSSGMINYLNINFLKKKLICTF